MEEKKAYSTSPELMHYGVKGMKWKDHAYRRLVNGQYVYDQNWRPSDRPGTVTPPVIKRRPQARQVYRESPAVSKIQNHARQIEYGTYLRNSPDKIYINHPKYGAKTVKTDSEKKALGKDNKNYNKYVKRSNDLNGNTREDVTYVNERGKKRLVTKTINEGSGRTIDAKTGETHTVTSTRVEPGRYDSYGKAIKGESTKAYKAASKSVKDAYRVTSNKVSAGSKEMKRVGAGAKAAAKSLKSSSKDLKRAATNAINSPAEDAKWIYDSVKSQKTTKDKINMAKGIYTENYANPIGNKIEGVKSGIAVATKDARGYKKDKNYKSTGKSWHNERQPDGSYKLVENKTTHYKDSKGNRLDIQDNPSRLFSSGYVYKNKDTGTTYTSRTRGALEIAGSKAIKSAKKATKKKNGR